jgi:ParB-like chromosome segregation protein Spo0J
MLSLGESPRLDGHDEAHVARLADVEGPLPPILVDSRTMRVIDGTHRLMAAIARGEKTIEAEYFDGEADDAFLYAVKANVTHGFPLTQADRRAAAARILRSHPHMSDRAIAMVAGLGAKTVASIRKSTDELPLLTTRVGSDGRIRPLNSLEGRMRVAALLSERPSASLREVARQAGVSPATVGDVRKRLERGDLPAGTRAGRPQPVPEPVAPGALVDTLLRDPSLRHNEVGRNLLGLLRHSATGAQHWNDFVAAVPPHCTGTVGQLAEQYARMWSQFAEEMGERARTIAAS